MGKDTGGNAVHRLARNLEQRGCTVKLTTRHLQVRIPGGGIVVAPTSASDWRGLKNLARDLRANGLDIHWKDLLK